MPYRVIPCSNAQDVADELNGTRLIGPVPTTGLPLGTLTLVFTSPAATVTFTGVAGAIRLPSQIVSDIKGTVGLTALQISLRNINGEIWIAIQLDAGFAIDNTGTANSLLKIPSAGVTGPAAIAEAKIKGFAQGALLGQYVLVIAP